ncbi:MAG: hypothetical protein ACYDCQ_12180 [Dehalococcoidia bacterium]
MYTNPTILNYLAEARYTESHLARRSLPKPASQIVPIEAASITRKVVINHYFVRTIGRVLGFAG